MDEFSRWRASVEKALNERIEGRVELVQEVALQALADAQTLSPVDTGHYRASHNLSVNKFEKVNSLASKKALSKARSKSINARTAAQRLEKAPQRLSVIPDLLKSLGKVTIYISNNAVYARRLEYGHSKAAPNGIYSVVRERALQNLKKGVKS